MKEELYKLIDAVVAGDDEAAKIHFSSYATKKTSDLMEAKQEEMFDDDGDDKKKPKSKFLVKPNGIGFDKKELAVEAAKNHPDKDVEVVDTETDEVVYSHKAKKKSKK